MFPNLRPMSMSAHGLHLSKPLPATSAVQTWPAVGSRALSAEERGWLEAVPAARMVEVEALGLLTGWVRSFFCGYVEEGLRRGRVRVFRDAEGVLCAEWDGGRRHRVLGEWREPQGPVRPAGRCSFFKPRSWKGGTHASYSAQD